MTDSEVATLEENDVITIGGITIDFSVLGSISNAKTLVQAFIDEPLLETNIEFYASAVDNLQNCITNILLNVDLTDNEELSALLSDYIMIVSAHNPCRQIMAMKNQGSPKERLSDFIAREISKVDFSKVNGANVFSPFVTLKKLIEYHESFIEKLYELAPSFNIENQEGTKK